MDWEDSGELSFRGGYEQGNYLHDHYDLWIESHYEDYISVIDRYLYSLEESLDDRSGGGWNLSVFAKKRFHGGLVLVASGGYESGDYEVDWYSTFAKYQWSDYSNTEVENLSVYPGAGKRHGWKAALGITKTVSLERRLDLTPGVLLRWAGTGLDERGDILIRSRFFSQGVSSSFEVSNPLSLERTRFLSKLILPLAVELRPASFFHFYSGFAAVFDWSREVRTTASPLLYWEGDASLDTEEMEVEENGYTSSFLVSLGFSLRYREKLFFDMYTGDDILPRSVKSSEYYFDLRYVF